MRLWSRIRDWPTLEGIARSGFPVDRYLCCYSGKLGHPEKQSRRKRLSHPSK